MKKLLLLMLLLGISFHAPAQDEPSTENKFPYEKLLKMTDEELESAKFKYDKNKNQWVLVKLNGLNQTAAVLGALAGSASNYVPHPNDYSIVVQKGLDGISSIEILFYNQDIYHDIVVFANDHGWDLIKTSSGKLTKKQFNYGDYSFVLNRTGVVQSSFVAGRGSLRSRDQSYEVFSFIIFTGLEPHSKWHTKEASKKAKRDAKGKKKERVDEFM